MWANRSGRSPKWAMWVNRSGRSPKMSNHEQIAQVAHQKWVICSENRSANSQPWTFVLINWKTRGHIIRLASDVARIHATFLRHALLRLSFYICVTALCHTFCHDTKSAMARKGRKYQLLGTFHVLGLHNNFQYCHAFHHCIINKFAPRWTNLSYVALLAEMSWA